MASEWSRLECEIIISDYFKMLNRECRGERYSKSDHRRKLQSKLDNRSEGSIEFKHQNISAVLVRAGQIYIRGYKPAWNYQSLLEDVVLEQVGLRDVELTEIENVLIEPPAEIATVADWSAVYVEPPDRTQEIGIKEPSKRVPRKFNFAEKEWRNRQLGDKGEEFVMELERNRLINLGRADLATDVEWTSKERGDGAGFDIRSFKDDKDEELFIEVKTTNLGIYQPFMLSINEIEYSLEFANSYSLYRIFDFAQSTKLFELQGHIDKHVNLFPKTYSASF